MKIEQLRHYYISCPVLHQRETNVDRHARYVWTDETALFPETVHKTNIMSALDGKPAAKRHLYQELQKQKSLSSALITSE